MAQCVKCGQDATGDFCQTCFEAMDYLRKTQPKSREVLTKINKANEPKEKEEQNGNEANGE